MEQIKIMQDCIKNFTHNDKPCVIENIIVKKDKVVIERLILNTRILK